MRNKLDKRRKEILSILSEVPISSTQQLADLTSVSNETIRKDLDVLADEGLIIKVHGGVALASAHANEIPFELRAATNWAEKRRIAKKALPLIEAGDTLLLESCTTNLELAKELVRNPELLESLMVITNSFSIAAAFDNGRKCKRIFFLGGWINPFQYSVLGHKTAAQLRDFHVSKAFLSGAALSSQFILGGYYDDDVEFQKNALTAAQKAVLMIDSSKFDRTAVFSVAHISRFNYLVTDRDLPTDSRLYLEKEGVCYLHA